MSATPGDLAIAGLVPLSTVDWPDHLVATIFTQGCPWRCTYCQNTALIDTGTAGIVGWDDVVELLDRRVGLLDGVVFTGGEATRQDALRPAMEAVRAKGFQVGLHTAGAYPRRLAEVIDLVDWVGLDVKALPEDYKPIIGHDVGAKAWESLDIVLSAAEARPDFTYEVRTTIHPGNPAVSHFHELIACLRAVGVTDFALQEARAKGTTPEFEAEAESWDTAAWREKWDRIVDDVRAAGFQRVAVRPA